MSKKVITGAVIALAAGIATYLYRKNRSKVNDFAQDAYDAASSSMHRAEAKAEEYFS